MVGAVRFECAWGARAHDCVSEALSAGGGSRPGKSFREPFPTLSAFEKSLLFACGCIVRKTLSMEQAKWANDLTGLGIATSMFVEAPLQIVGDAYVPLGALHSFDDVKDYHAKNGRGGEI